MLFHPLRAGHDAGFFIGEADVIGLAEAEEGADLVDGVDAGGVAVLVEEAVAGNLDGVGEAEHAVRAAFLGDPAMEGAVAVGDASRGS